ncbi:hypothetical protein YQE_06793, partial [Dendroctonus ponderosae]
MIQQFIVDEKCGLWIVSSIDLAEFSINVFKVLVAANIDHPNLKEHSCFHTIRQFSTRKKRLKSRRRKDSVSQSKQECKEPHAFKAETDVCIFCSQEVPLNILEKHENAHREEEKRRAKQQKMHYPKEGTTICTICGTLVVCKDLKKHERTHRRLSTVICTICGFSAKNIYQHMGTHSEERRFACQECGMAFKYKKNLDVHMLVHEKVGKHKCSTCGKAFKTPYNLRVHIRSHQDVKPFSCHYCEKTFTTKQSRDNHAKTHITHSI